MHFRNLIVIGASAGGLDAIKKVISGLSGQIDAAVVVVIHLSRKSNSKNIADVFQKNTSLICGVASDDAPLKKGHLYVAAPENHVMFLNHTLRLKQGPHENKYRPSIDVLFRSAAVRFGHRTIGIILTGLLEDGTSGMSAIKRSGGICMVQDPAEAQFSDMPRSVLNKIKVDYKASVDDIAAIINKILTNPLPPKIPIPMELKIEADLAEKMMSDINELKKIADYSDFSCPDCGGGLWAIKNDPLNRYRCHTGHVFTEKSLVDSQNQNIEESLWIAIRILEEKENLLLLRSKHEYENGELELSSSYRSRMTDISKHITRLKSFLVRLHDDMYKTS